MRYEDLANGFLDDERLVIAGGQAYRYDDRHYVPVQKLKIDLRRWMKANSIRQTNALVDNVAPIVEAVATTDRVLPCWSNGRREQLVPFNNGLLRLEPFATAGAVDLLSHTPEYLSTWVIPADFDPAATCPRWLKFLDECLVGEADQVALCQEWFGYVLSGDTDRQKYMTHIGARGSGKSTAARILQRIVGSGSVAFDLRRLAGRFGLAALQGRGLAVCGEVELAGCKERSEIIEKLKTITGEDTVQIERKGDNVYRTEALPVRFHIISNSMPLLRDPTLALARRMLILWSPTSAADADPGLEAKLLAELPGIVTWALEGYRRLRQAGRFTVTDRMTSEVRAVERDASPVIAFLRDLCEVHKSLDGGTLPDVAWVDGPAFESSKEAIWKAAAHWELESHVDLPDSPAWFWRDMRCALPLMTAERIQRRVNGKMTDVIPGVRLKAST